MSFPTIHDQLVFAAGAHNFERVRKRVTEGANVNHESEGRGTPLFAAAQNSMIVTYLLNLGADANGYQTPKGETILDRALSLPGTADSAKLLLKAGAKTNLSQILPPPDGKTLIVGRLYIDGGEHVRRYITRGQVSYGILDTDDESPLFEWASPGNYTGFVGESMVGNLVTLEGMFWPEDNTIFYIEQDSYEFHLVDYEDNRITIKPEDCDLRLDAAFTIHG